MRGGDRLELPKSPPAHAIAGHIDNPDREINEEGWILYVYQHLLLVVNRSSVRRRHNGALMA
jgi:hypothetical protein